MHSGSSIRLLAVVLLTAAFSIAATIPTALAAEQWAVRSGETSIRLNENLMGGLGLEITAVEGAHSPTIVPRMDHPAWGFAIHPSSDLTFQIDAGVPVPRGLVSGAIRHQGSITITDLATGNVTEIRDLEIAFIDRETHPPTAATDDSPLYLRSGAAGSPAILDMGDSMFRFLPEEPGLRIHYLNMAISGNWATTLGRPELAGLVIGMAEVAANVEYLSGVSENEPYEPNFTDGFLDVKLGILDRIQQAGHEGIYPDGVAGLTMATTSCNVGSVDVPWLAPMEEDHPLIHMALYRELDGRFEQVGVSWMKHGFFALSNSQCTLCQHPSNGTFLGVGCSDTYGPGNNSDRRYLGPRDEVDPFAGTWECTGSHFAGGLPDCIRRHDGSGHNSVEHLLVVADADLGDENATYYYEGYYVVRGDQDKMNNWASRICSMTWDNRWDFTTPGTNNPLVEGPALLRWGTLQTYVPIPDDGQVLLAVDTRVVDLGQNIHGYEYALLNMDSDREIRSFSMPVAGNANVTNIEFHDSDLDPTNDWQGTVEGGLLTWSTAEYGNENARPLVFGELMNFRFEADSPPESRDATLGIFKPGTGTEVAAQTLGPQTQTTAVPAAASSASPAILLHPVHPNPFNAATNIRFELAGSAPIKLTIVDASGRLVRTLVDRTMEPGSYDVTWDGTDSSNRRIASGVYYARVQTGGQVRVQTMVVVE